ncbi:MAG TPA: cell division protein FtsA [Terriglobales bacterium]|nr:cell division protein FtsA [Terriglobales bacterium]
MSKQSENLLTAIDVGSAKVVAVVAEVTDGGLRYRGHGIADSRGSRRGLIVDLDKAVSSVQKAVEQAENATGAAVERAVVGVAGPHIRGLNSQGGITIGSRPRDISKEDIKQVIERARAVSLPPDREILHVMPQDFIVDDQHGIHDPEGMPGMKLEARVHLITSATVAAQNVVTVLNLAGIEVEDRAFEARASADAVLKQDERELGVCVIDIGAGSSDLMVVHEGVVVHTGVIPIGGYHFTNDLAVGLCTPVGDAEMIKRSFGCAVVTRIPEANEIEVPSVGDRPPRMMAQRLVAEFLEPRARELFEMTRDHLRQAGVIDPSGRGFCNTGFVLTGGGARLAGLADIVESVLHKPSRVATPASLPKMPAELAEPEFATVIGLLLYGYLARMTRATKHESGPFRRLKSFFARARA